MDRKRLAILASSTMVLIAGWMPYAATTTVVVGGITMVSGCAGSGERSDTRQDTRVETRTEDRVQSRRD